MDIGAGIRLYREAKRKPNENHAASIDLYT